MYIPDRNISKRHYCTANLINNSTLKLKKQVHMPKYISWVWMHWLQNFYISKLLKSKLLLSQCIRPLLSSLENQQQIRRNDIKNLFHQNFSEKRVNKWMKIFFQTWKPEFATLIAILISVFCFKKASVKSTKRMWTLEFTDTFQWVSTEMKRHVTRLHKQISPLFSGSNNNHTVYIRHDKKGHQQLYIRQSEAIWQCDLTLPLFTRRLPKKKHKQGILFHRTNW